ncbi:hypothetical protein [uncultured Algibacter sp.]|uniref:hypothetical protein n=1 Tax=uncultured Algibacter sp. TaxID=298659 RepID=UPI0026278145|nr:hypothetical protein [uncultured Algibacter sp.]
MRLIFLLIALFTLLSTSSCATHVRTRPNQVTVIKTPPKHYKVVRVKGKRYYVWNGKHYRKTRSGYVFVKV